MYRLTERKVRIKSDVIHFIALIMWLVGVGLTAYYIMVTNSKLNIFVAMGIETIPLLMALILIAKYESKNKVVIEIRDRDKVLTVKKQGNNQEFDLNSCKSTIISRKLCIKDGNNEVILDCLDEDIVKIASVINSRASYNM